MNTPNWAQDLIINAVMYLQGKGYKCELPDIKWRKPTARKWDFATNTESKIRRKDSSGICYRNHITICAGSDRRDCKLVILHELAHWALPLGSNDHEGHSPRFWDLAFNLYKEFGLPLRVCLERERHYRKESVNAYRRIKGSK